nr:hypothetical protein BaRGS_034722 [Batillaria attramentaria]
MTNTYGQVVEILESDNEFKKKLEQANISDIKSGAIAQHLELVNNSIRTRLDEIKRMEVAAFAGAGPHQDAQHVGGTVVKVSITIAAILFLQNSARGVLFEFWGVNRMDIPTHLDLRNPHSFEMKDLENLIKKTTTDLEELDKQRRKDFKEYEMEKEFEYQEKLKEMPEEERKKMEAKHKELKQKHKEHEKINHPLDKVYDARNNPEEDDPMERFEEMNRMREHVFTEIDKDKDFMITMDEFLAYTGQHGDNEKFKEDEGWKTVDEEQVFTDEEFQDRCMPSNKAFSSLAALASRSTRASLPKVKANLHKVKAILHKVKASQLHELTEASDAHLNTEVE